MTGFRAREAWLMFVITVTGLTLVFTGYRWMAWGGRSGTAIAMACFAAALGLGLIGWAVWKRDQENRAKRLGPPHQRR